MEITLIAIVLFGCTLAGGALQVTARWFVPAVVVLLAGIALTVILGMGA